jgi:hypothetical protein
MANRYIQDASYRRGRRSTPEYGSWKAMRNRCLTTSDKDYKWYGGRGVTICARWNSFEAFAADMGPRPPGTTLDRFPNKEGNYEPSNCRWATDMEQARNRRGLKLEDHEYAQIVWLRSEGFAQAEIARFFEIDQSHVSRISAGIRTSADRRTRVQ